MRSSMSKTSSQKNNETKKSSKITSWPSTLQERKYLYEKYAAQRGRLSYQYLDLMMRGEDIFKGLSKQALKRAYIKANALGNGKNEGFITRRLFPYFLKFLNYFSEIWMVFDRMDDEKMNKLSKDKFVRNRSAIDKNMSKTTAEQLFTSVDADGTGSVSFDEFCNWVIEQETFLGINNKQFFEINNQQFEESIEENEDYPDEKKENSNIEILKSEIDETKIVNSMEDLDELRLRVRDLELENQLLKKRIEEDTFKNEKILPSEFSKDENENFEGSISEIQKAGQYSENLEEKINLLEKNNEILKIAKDDQILKSQQDLDSINADYKFTQNQLNNHLESLRISEKTNQCILKEREDERQKYLEEVERIKNESLTKEIEKTKIIEERNFIIEENRKSQDQLKIVSEKLIQAEEKIRSLSNEKENYFLIESELIKKIRDFYDEFNEELGNQFINLKENFNLKNETIEVLARNQEGEDKKQKALAEIEALKSYQQFLKLSCEKMKEKEKNILEMEILKDDLIKKNKKINEDYKNLEEQLKTSAKINQIENLKNEYEIKSFSIENQSFINELNVKIVNLLTNIEAKKILNSQEIESVAKSLANETDESLKHRMQNFIEKLKLIEERIQNLLNERENEKSKAHSEFETLSKEKDQLEKIFKEKTQIFEEKINKLTQAKYQLEEWFNKNKIEYQELQENNIAMEKKIFELEKNLNEAEFKYFEIEKKLICEKKDDCNLKEENNFLVEPNIRGN